MNPMLCETSDIFDDEDYSFEIKWDGERAILFIANGKVEIQNRRGKMITYRYPELQAISGRATPSNNYSDGRTKRIVDVELGKTATLDGEIIVLTEGRSNFDLLAQRSHLENKFDIELRSAKIPVTFMCFDILNLEGQDLTGEPLRKRQQILFSEFKEIDGIFKHSAPLIGTGEELFEMVKQRNLEGLVAKHRASPYLQRRSPYWKKIKYEKTADVTVTSYTVNNAGIRVANDSGFGCQASGYHAPLLKQIIDTEGFAVIEIKYLNLTPNGKYRMPTYKGVKR